MDDFIRRKDAQYNLEQAIDDDWEIDYAIDRLNEISAADVAPVLHGKWKKENPDYLDGDSVYICSICGETWNLEAGTPQENNMNYCPNCGAKMDL